jgi:hypothetical protein
MNACRTCALREQLWSKSMPHCGRSSCKVNGGSGDSSSANSMSGTGLKLLLLVAFVLQSYQMPAVDLYRFMLNVLLLETRFTRTPPQDSHTRSDD